MVSYGVRESEICLLIKNPETGQPIDETTLRIHFREEIDTGFVKANTAVADSMYHMATKIEPSSVKLGAASFWLARRAGWKETVVQERTGDSTIRVEDARQKLIDELDRVAARKEAEDDGE
jgi:hypothetical protein